MTLGRWRLFMPQPVISQAVMLNEELSPLNRQLRGSGCAPRDLIPGIVKGRCIGRSIACASGECSSVMVNCGKQLKCSAIARQSGCPGHRASVVLPR